VRIFFYIFNFAVIFLLLVSIIFVGTINNFNEKFYKHLFSIIIGVFLFYYLTLTPKFSLKKISDYGFFIWLVSFFVIVLNLFVGTVVNGSRGWIYLGSFSFQPAELTKLGLLFLFLWLLKRSYLSNKLFFFLSSMFFSFITILPILLQPDLGFSILLFFTFLLSNYGVGISLFLLSFVFVSSLVFGSFIIKPYQLERLTTFLDPYKDPLGSGWQIVQSVNCLISGGLWGNGIGKGLIYRLGFLPEKDTDFIFSVIAEDTGLVGSIFLIFIFLLLLLSLIVFYSNAKDIESRLVIIFVFGIFFVQSFINLAMNSMSGPVTGLPLPLVSYGGTNMVVTLFLLGIVNRMAFDILKSEKIERWVS